MKARSRLRLLRFARPSHTGAMLGLLSRSGCLLAHLSTNPRPRNADWIAGVPRPRVFASWSGFLSRPRLACQDPHFILVVVVEVQLHIGGRVPGRRTKNAARNTYVLGFAYHRVLKKS